MGATTIGKAARQAGVNVETIRFYERSGLISRPTKREIGYRHYADEIIVRVRFIKSIQELGFKLSEIGSILAHLENGDIDCGVAEKLTDDKVGEIDAKIQSLQTMKKALMAFKEQCAMASPDGMCIINELYQPERKNKEYAS